MNGLVPATLVGAAVVAVGAVVAFLIPRRSRAAKPSVAAVDAGGTAGVTDDGPERAEGGAGSPGEGCPEVAGALV